MFRNSKTLAFYDENLKPLVDVKVFCYSRRKLKPSEIKEKFDKALKKICRKIKKEFSILIVGIEENEMIDEDELELDKIALGVDFKENEIYRQVIVFESGYRIFNEKDIRRGFRLG